MMLIGLSILIFLLLKLERSLMNHCKILLRRPHLMILYVNESSRGTVHAIFLSKFERDLINFSSAKKYPFPFLLCFEENLSQMTVRNCFIIRPVCIIFSRIYLLGTIDYGTMRISRCQLSQLVFFVHYCTQLRIQLKFY